jgi:hypothetical protein
MFEYQNLKAYMHFYFLNVWTHGSFIVEYVKVHKKIEMILWTFDKEKKTFETKNSLVHMFFLNALNV